MTVYVITSGEYSDYRICAVTLDPQKAERLKVIYDACDYTGASIEEYEIDAHSDRLLAGDRLYAVIFDKRGNVQKVYDSTMYDSCEDIFQRIIDNSIVVKVFARDEDAAIKISAERRTKFLAEKEGIA